jgi:hypothetical protein
MLAIRAWIVKELTLLGNIKGVATGEKHNDYVCVFLVYCFACYTCNRRGFIMICYTKNNRYYLRDVDGSIAWFDTFQDLLDFLEQEELELEDYLQ